MYSTFTSRGTWYGHHMEILNVQPVRRLGKLTREIAIGKYRMYRGYVPAVFQASILRVNPGCTQNETCKVNGMGTLGMSLKITGLGNCRYVGWGNSQCNQNEPTRVSPGKLCISLRCTHNVLSQETGICPQ